MSDVRKPMAAHKKPEADRLIAAGIAGATDDCIEWTLATNTSGYGMRRVSGKGRLVTHLVLEEVVGPRPDGMEACHSCHNPACINSRHLRWDTRSANRQDMWDAGTYQRGELAPNAKLTEADVRRIKFGKERAIDLSREYDVTYSHILAIRRGARWSHVTQKEKTNG